MRVERLSPFVTRCGDLDQTSAVGFAARWPDGVDDICAVTADLASIITLSQFVYAFLNREAGEHFDAAMEASEDAFYAATSWRDDDTDATFAAREKAAYAAEVSATEAAFRAAVAIHCRTSRQPKLWRGVHLVDPLDPQR